MPKQRSKASASGEKAGSDLRSDEEILRDRKRLEAFDTADLYLGGVGWGLWALAVCWFVYFLDHAPVVDSLLLGATDACLALFVCGLFCRGISKASPRQWSAWRIAFHFAWCVIFALLAVVAALLALRRSANVSSNTCWALTAACGALSFGAFATLPGTVLNSGKAANAPLGRCLLILDGAAGLAVAAFAVQKSHWGDGPADGLGPITTAMTVLPLGAWAVGLCLCSTEAEILVAAPSSMVFALWAGLRFGYYNGPMAAIPMAALIIVHATLYLPLPFEDPDSNPFHMSLRRFGRRMVRLMSQPVSGFGDDGD